MKHYATILQKDLQTAITKTERVKTGTNAPLAILEDTLVEILKSSAITFKKNNLAVTVIAGANAATIEPLTFMLPSAALPVLKSLHKEADIEIWFDTVNLELELRHAEMRLHFVTEDPSNFPVDFDLADKFTEVTIPEPGDFFTMLDIAKKFTSDDDLRPAMTGVLFTDTGIVATDAHRLVVVDNKLSDTPFGVILSKDFVTAAQGIDGKAGATFKTDGVICVYHNKSTKVIARNIDARFPDYKVVLPEFFEVDMEVDTEMFKQHIKMAAHMANKTTNQVVAEIFPNRYVLAARDEYFGQRMDITGDCSFNSPHGDEETGFVIGFNAKFALDALNLIGDLFVTILMNTPSKPVVMKEGVYTYLIMPLMLPRD